MENMNRNINVAIIVFVIIILVGCGPNKKTDPNTKDTSNNNTTIVDTNKVNISTSGFNADTAYMYIEKQMSFGNRIPNSDGHKKCGEYLEKELKKYAEKVIVQKAKVKAYTGEVLNIKNFVAQFNIKATKRVALFAHWDTRPFADRTEATAKNPVPGADDGGSGVGVLLEIARNLKLNPTTIGVDIIFFDAEDWGDDGGDMNTWCLGSQYWAKNNPISGYKADYGILLDMVGAKGAMFYKEGNSRKYAPTQTDNVWNMAINSGYGSYFIDAPVGEITDDHFYVNTISKIPTVDIINHNGTSFGPHWHTPNDDLTVIDKSVLKAVGQTVYNLIYNEK